MDEGRNLDHDGLLKESSSSVMARVMARVKKTTACNRRVLLMVIALLFFVLVLVVAVLAVLIRQDSKSYQAKELQADQVFARYGSPPDHGQEWTCSTFVNNIQCWDGSYTYLHTQSGWTLLQGPDD